jgi:hypothetical protein
LLTQNSFVHQKTQNYFVQQGKNFQDPDRSFHAIDRVQQTHHPLDRSFQPVDRAPSPSAAGVLANQAKIKDSLLSKVATPEGAASSTARRTGSPGRAPGLTELKMPEPDAIRLEEFKPVGVERPGTSPQNVRFSQNLHEKFKAKTPTGVLLPKEKAWKSLEDAVTQLTEEVEFRWP